MSRPNKIANQELEYRKNNLYEWLEKKVIESCNHPSHLEPCNLLIDFFEKQGGDKELAERLRKYLDIKEKFIFTTKIDKRSKDEKIIEMFYSGKYTYNEIAESLNSSYSYVRDLICKSFSKQQIHKQ